MSAADPAMDHEFHCSHESTKRELDLRVDSDYLSSPSSPSSADGVSTASGCVSHEDMQEFASFSRKRRGSKRTLQIEYWDRDDETRRRKEEHTAALDRSTKYESREDYILATILAGKQHHIEPNLFPYQCPSGIEHWTLWSRSELTEERVENFVESWIAENMPACVAWEYDDND
eukprot:TRINITY_DN175_c0_g1_i3.p1 TRINITY_DN175_c0_g1~~TRINITY_DN175_c0_g1_i3.p1  ORF type:complete len:174 (+),score=25.40 TRINITY_DN175_c0_g1_i3:137-658(+)